MIPVMPNEGGFGEIDCSRRYRKQGPFLCGDNFRSFAAPGKGRPRVARRAKRSGFRKAVVIRPVSFSHRTSRKSRCAAPPAPEPALPWFQLAAAGPAEPANSRISSNRPVCRLRSGRSAHNCRLARLRPWITVSFAPRRAMRSGELQVKASSSFSLASGRRWPAPVKRIGYRKSIGVGRLRSGRVRFGCRLFGRKIYQQFLLAAS